MTPRSIIRFASLLTVSLALSGVLAAADEAKKDSLPARGQLPANWSKLGLSEDQKQKVYAIRGEHRAKIQELEVKLKDLRQKEKADLEKVLTEDQKLRLRELLATKAGLDTTKPDAKKDEPKKDEKK